MFLYFLLNVWTTKGLQNAYVNMEEEEEKAKGGYKIGGNIKKKLCIIYFGMLRYFLFVLLIKGEFFYGC